MNPEFEFQERAWNLGISMSAAFGLPAGVEPLPESAYEPGTGDAPVAPNSLLAWDPATGKARWCVPCTDTVGGGTLTTAANLVFRVVRACGRPKPGLEALRRPRPCCHEGLRRGENDLMLGTS